MNALDNNYCCFNSHRDKRTTRQVLQRSVFPLISFSFYLVPLMSNGFRIHLSGLLAVIPTYELSVTSELFFDAIRRIVSVEHVLLLKLHVFIFPFLLVFE